MFWTWHLGRPRSDGPFFMARAGYGAQKALRIARIGGKFYHWPFKTVLLQDCAIQRFRSWNG